MIHFEARGIRELEAKLAMLSRVSVWAHPIMQKAVLYVHSQVPPYPAPPVGSTYRRTGTLGRTITTDVKSLSGNEIAGYIGTNTVYAPWVISSEKVGSRGPQAKAHRGRWYTLQGVVVKATQGVRQIFETEIRRLLRS